jgi:hypothetical protein
LHQWWQKAERRRRGAFCHPLHALVEQSRKAAENPAQLNKYNFPAQFQALFRGNYNMNKNEKSQFESDYQQLLKCLKLQGKADKTIEAYSRALCDRKAVERRNILPSRRSDTG